MCNIFRFWILDFGFWIGVRVKNHNPFTKCFCPRINSKINAKAYQRGSQSKIQNLKSKIEHGIFSAANFINLIVLVRKVVPNQAVYVTIRI